MIMYRFAEKKRTGLPIMGFNLTFPSPDFAEFMGYLGFDYVFIDAEHFSFNMETIQSIARVSELTNMLPIARVPKNDPQMILGYLETGILGIVVPHINTAKDAQEIVDAVKYYPLGKRGANARARTARYGLKQTPAQYFEQANQQSVVITMIEELEGIQNLPEILCVSGVDYIDIGPSDLAMSVGLPGQSDHPQIQDLIKNAKRQIFSSDKGLVASVSTIEAGIQAIKEGAKLIEFNTNNFIKREALEFLQQSRSHQ